MIVKLLCPAQKVAMYTGYFNVLLVGHSLLPAVALLSIAGVRSKLEAD